MENIFDGHLGCHPVSMQLPKDASLALIGFIMYRIPSQIKNKNISLEVFYPFGDMHECGSSTYTFCKQPMLILTM